MGKSSLEYLRRETRREPAYVYLMLLGSFVLTGLVFTALYMTLYPYLAIAPPTGGGGSGASTGPPPSLPNKILSDLLYYLSIAFSSRPALALFYTVLLTATFLNEFSYFLWLSTIVGFRNNERAPGSRVFLRFV